MTASSIPVTVTESTITGLPASSNYGADYYVRQLLYANRDPDSSITSFYKELLRFLKVFFGQFKIRNTQNELIPVKCVHGLAERAIAKQLQSNTLQLPLIAISAEKTANNPEQQHYNSNYSTEVTWDDKKQRAIRIISLAPKAVKIEYELAVWATYTEQLDQLSEQIQRLFNPFIEINTPFTKYGAMFIESEYSQIEREVSDRNDRTLIRTYRVIIETYLPSPRFLMTSTGQLEQITYEAQVYDPEREIP